MSMGLNLFASFKASPQWNRAGRGATSFAVRKTTTPARTSAFVLALANPNLDLDASLLIELPLSRLLGLLSLFFYPLK